MASADADNSLNVLVRASLESYQGWGCTARAGPIYIYKVGWRKSCTKKLRSAGTTSSPISELRFFADPMLSDTLFLLSLLPPACSFQWFHRGQRSGRRDSILRHVDWVAIN